MFKKLSMLFLGMLFMTNIIQANVEKEKIYEGTYQKSTNTFSYVKNNLVFKDKTLHYQLIDNENLLDNVYNFLGSKFNITESDQIGLKILAVPYGGSLLIKRIINYQITEDQLNSSDGSIDGLIQ